MEPEKDPSSSAQKPSVLLGLLGTLVSFFVVWRLSKSYAPLQNPNAAIHGQEPATDQHPASQHIPHASTWSGINSIRPPDRPPATEESKKDTDKPPKWWRMHIVQVLIFLATASYAVVSLLMWCAMQTANQQQLTAFRTDERAWIGIEPLKAKLKSPATDKFTALYTYDMYLRNGGKTAARCVEVRFPRGGDLSSIDFINHKDWIANVQDRFLLGKFKGSEGIPIVRSAPQTISPGQTTPVPIDFYGQAPKVYPSGGEFISFFIGRIDYIDDFSVPHWVKFCMFVESADGSLGYCKYGNEEDGNPEIPPKVQPSCPVTQPR